MAGLSPPGSPGTGSETSPDRDRAQIILVTAFALAVAFVALSVVINGAIFTQNLATRGDTAGGGDALQQRQQAEQMVGDLLEHANANYSDDRSKIETEFSAAVRDLSNASAYQQSVAGRAVDYAYVGETDGKRVFQDTAGDFTNTSGTGNWTVAESVDNARQFDIYVSDTDELDDPDDDPFTVNLTDTSSDDTWRLALAEESSTLNLTVTYTDGPDSFSTTCTAPEPSSEDLKINVTAGLFAGEPCDALVFARNVSGGTDGFETYDIQFDNSGDIRGTYSLTVDTTSDIGDAPTQENVLYSATVEYTYRTANLVYETDIRVAPGEPDD
ncbi:DUF7261 family protein [Salinirussus salinus]|uniref:DUF7261 family protein n=1 Tax=Salinirussus salinus TaxID=1198300 RepID=UPI001358273B|nr:hypothetical protein [Salinirussus salinus]